MAVDKTTSGGSAREARGYWFILLPLAAGYFLSYFFRNVNGPVGGDIIRDMGTNAGTLGLLTGVYFLAFTFSQLPLGGALDRFGPRRVQTTLLLVAAGGALVFASAGGVRDLLTGRFLIGLGTAGCLTAGLKATMQWCERERLSAINGMFVMCGGLGAMAATVPVAHLADYAGWRATFVILAAIAILLAGATFIMVPEPPPAATKQASGWTPPARSLRRGTLIAFAPMSALTFGVASAWQGLWAARWLSDSGTHSAASVNAILLAMAAALTTGALLFGWIAFQLHGRVGSGTLALLAAGGLVSVECLICAGAPLPDIVLWPAVSLFGAIPVLSYGVLAERYPHERIGRTNAILNMCHTGTAFAAQYLIGVMVGLWPRMGEGYAITAYRSAMLAVIACQIVAIAIFAAHNASGAQGRVSANQPAE